MKNHDNFGKLRIEKICKNMKHMETHDIFGKLRIKSICKKSENNEKLIILSKIQRFQDFLHKLIFSLKTIFSIEFMFSRISAPGLKTLLFPYVLHGNLSGNPEI